jgi:peptidoglycan hydrolase-like protein with peptidoglycan-binding domain
MSNADVLRLQIRLGVYPQTGYFGTITFAAVVKYQGANNITPTGFVGPITRAKLNSTL